MAASSPSVDRRAEMRHLVSCAASLERPDGKQRLSLVRDLSASGARVYVASNKVSVGDAVRLLLHLDEADYPATGRLVRVEAAEDAGVWKKEVAVRFDERIDLDVSAVPRELVEKDA